jgi:opacity protein-like surface antigen
MTCRVATLALGLLVLASGASAQGRSVYVSLGGGLTVPLSQVRNNFGNGWNLGMGFLFPVTGAVDVQLDFVHVRLADRSETVDAAGSPVRADQLVITASHFMDAGTASIRFTPARQARRVKAYALCGAGVYYRKVTLTSVGAGLATVCNPWWFVCSGQAVTLDTVTGRRNSVGVGVSVGGGIAIAVNEDVTAFVEARFHDILTGPSFVTPGAGAITATGQYLPITIGVRF